MNIPFVDLYAQYKNIQNEIDSAINTVIKESAYIGGRYVKAFELEFADFCKVKHCISVGNGTDALFIVLKALSIGQEDDVITTAHTFVATSEAVSASEARIQFVDCDPSFYTIDVNLLEKKITKKTKAIIPVHLYGQPADMNTISAIAKKYKLFIIEDAAQAHGARLRQKLVGTFGNAACFSFYPGKNLGAYGDGGSIVTDDDDLAQKCRLLANHGRFEKYAHLIEGYNSRLDGLQAAILSVKLKHLEKWNQERRRIAAYYRKNIDSPSITHPSEMTDAIHVYHLYVVKAEKRDGLRNYLKEKGIETGIHYPIPLPFQKAYHYLNHKPGDFPVSESLASQILSLPMYAELTNAQLDYIIESIHSFYKST